ncbi:MAG: hypothetical protein P4M08_03535 [Oligoflexia bacterium]|nr:hypothetical protein [Oligoflexia bacterium]
MKTFISITGMFLLSITAPKAFAADSPLLTAHEVDCQALSDNGTYTVRVINKGNGTYILNGVAIKNTATQPGQLDLNFQVGNQASGGGFHLVLDLNSGEGDITENYVNADGSKGGNDSTVSGCVVGPN